MHVCCTEPRRASLIDKQFNFPGFDDLPPGRWEVRRMVDDTYECCLVSDDPTLKNKETFDIGFVIALYKLDMQRLRENVM